jgi:hypothetical protein
MERMSTVFILKWVVMLLAIKMHLDENTSGNDFTLMWVRNYLSPQEKKLHNYEL